MPIYEYRCDNCGHEFETIQKVSEDPLKTCPACEKDALRKKVSAAGFRLKGGGWYETDFKSNKKRNVAGEEKAPKDGEGGKSSEKGGEKSSSDNGGSKRDSGTGSSGDTGKSSSEGKGSSSTSKSKSKD